MEEKENRNLLKAMVVPVILLAMMMISYFLESKGWVEWRQFGIRPREPIGLLGVLFTPFLHGSLEHLFNNSVPLLVLGTSLFYFYREIALKTILWIALMGGFWVWVAARPSNHIGMSGVIYGLVSFLFFSGVFRKNMPLIAISLLMVFMYGSLIWGIFPIKEGVSWEGHLFGAISGIVLAFYFKEEGPQRKLYQWEIDEIEELKQLEEQAKWQGLEVQDVVDVEYEYIPEKKDLPD